MPFVKFTRILLIFVILPFTQQLFSQHKQNDSIPYVFKIEKQIKTTPVKSQDNTGTCWSFATTSFIETEALRAGKEEFDLSEMYFVHEVYSLKAQDYIRYQGKTNFGEGGQAHDVINILQSSGSMPETKYTGLNYGTKKHNHEELSVLLKAMLDVFISNKLGKLPETWINVYKATLDAYLGSPDNNFDYNGKNYSSVDFEKNEVGINPDDYIEITSFSHHPYYSQFVLEIPDNWAHALYYNIPLEDLMKIMYNSIDKNISFVWDGDVSCEGFSHQKGYAILPEKKSEKEKKDNANLKEQLIDQELRQKEFNNYTTTDDHLMHITGIVTDQNGTKYFLTKNSWGTKSNKQGGFVYMSDSYVRLNTIAILVHKSVIPEDIAKKLSIKQ